MGYTDFFDDFKDLTRVDWSLMKEKYWRDTDEDPDRSRRRQAEFLVHNFFPWNLVSNVAVYDGSVATTVSGILTGQSPTVAIQQGWYY
jgi:ssDNA thymidine ADP-ribosyltransferase, DarT